MVWLTELAGDSPWWSDPGAIETDAYVAAWERSSVRWYPSILGDFTLDKDAVYTLRGARQIGKTTSIKLLIRTLLHKGVRPHNILFYSCDIAGDPNGLYGVVGEYLRHRERDKSERTFIFLDEISSVRKWQMAIKRLWDRGSLKNCTVLATGSHTVDLTYTTERLPGRRGNLNEAMDKVFRPLSFLEFAMLTDKHLSKKISALGGAHRRDAMLDAAFSGSVPGPLRPLLADLDALNACLTDYAACGGIPRIVEEALRRREIPEDAYASYLDAMLGDFASFRRRKGTVEGIVAALIDSVGRPVSWTSLAKKTGIPNESTVMSYVSILEEIFTLSIMRQYDAKSKHIKPIGGRKIHFADPFYLHALNGWVKRTEAYHASQKLLADERSAGPVVEGIVAGHLIRMAFRRSPKKPWFRHSMYLAYWKYGPQKEVDFVYNDGAVEVPIEVRFTNRLTKRDLDGIIAFKKAAGAKSGLVLTRNTLCAERECVKIPASMFLLLV